MIIPISSRMGINASFSSAFNVPTAIATITISFPRHAARAIFSLSSTGQGNEEFWWSNFIQSDILTFGPGANAFGYSPFRKVQVLIDGQIADVQWPFPIIFTGGVAPGLWSPVVEIDAFDFEEYEIDITPWLPRLRDGNMHAFSIKVVGLEDNGKNWTILSEITGSSWRTLTISSAVKTQSESQSITWTQSLSHTDQGQFLYFGNAQINQISTSGTDTPTGLVSYSNKYSYPLFANTTATNTPDGNVRFLDNIRRSKNIIITGTSVFPSPLEAFATYTKSSALVLGAVDSALTTTKNGTATLFQSPSQGVSTSFGTTSQEMRLGVVSRDGAMGMQPDTELYYRSIAAVNGTVENDVQSLVGEHFET
ncbi:hypothetical protein EYC80_010205 [Monilinia laxa]|uniref:Peptide N-acetyl-beta-D-glucosaminyl asparaginase amidase A N-terminal domain-containing protein n=1 Tax=Monilinia laxa TaxID=61186 RepID=A0A5N6JLT7_MONLA|nr:hypothetical protein EYC80_010205 [Monilinia laxa]